jgi:uncharacterized protein (TIGR00251 family)
MRITVRVKPNARRNDVRRLDDKTYQVSVTAPPADGAANERLVELLADYFDRPKSAVAIVRGASARVKLVDIE